MLKMLKDFFSKLKYKIWYFNKRVIVALTGRDIGYAVTFPRLEGGHFDPEVDYRINTPYDGWIPLSWESHTEYFDYDEYAEAKKLAASTHSTVEKFSKRRPYEPRFMPGRIVADYRDPQFSLDLAVLNEQLSESDADKVAYESELDWYRGYVEPLEDPF